MASQKIEISDLNHLKTWVNEFSQSVGAPCLILLSGEMGVGKTQLVKYLVQSLGGVNATSPSYAIHNRYDTQPIIEHLDLYRLENEDDLESVGFWDLFEAQDRLIIVEWAERLDKSFLPQNWPTIELLIERGTTEGARLITISK